MRSVQGLAEKSPLFHSKTPRIDGEMDMTPMVDVTFLLLIFFMVTASFAMQKSFQVPTPKSSQPTTRARTVQDFENDPEYVVVRLDRFNTFHVHAASWTEDEEAPSLQDLLVQLRKARSAEASRGGATKMLLVCHGEALHERVVQGIDAGNEVGMEEIKIVTTEEDSEE